MTASATYQIALQITQRANKALDRRAKVLTVEMELFFSCLIRKRLYFDRTRSAGGLLLTSPDARVELRFHPVMAKVCTLTSDDLESLPLVDFPLERIETFRPRWLDLDYVRNGWQGTFGWAGQS